MRPHMGTPQGVVVAAETGVEMLWSVIVSFEAIFY